MEIKVLECLKRLEEVEKQISDPNIFSNPKEYSSLSKEHARLSEIKNAHESLVATKKILQDDKLALSTEKDPEIVAMLEEGVLVGEEAVEHLSKQLENLLIPPDPDDDLSVIMELRAGTGGDEAALFVGDCVRMYHLYAASKGWQCEVLSASESDLGGYKEYVMGI